MPKERQIHPGHLRRTQEVKGAGSEERLTRDEAREVETSRDIEAISQCIESLKMTGRNFDNALNQYQELLRAHAGIEQNLDQLQQTADNEKEVANVKAKATKLLWATMRHLTSGTMVGTAIGAGAYTFTNDPVTTALAGAGGVLAGCVIENRLRAAEIKADRSEEYYRIHPETQAFIEDQDRQVAKEEERAAAKTFEIEDLNQAYVVIQERIAAIEIEIDELGNSDFTLLRSPDQASEPQIDEEKIIRELAGRLQEISREFDQLLERYYHLTRVVEEADINFEHEKFAHDYRDLIVSINALSRKGFEIARRMHMTVGAGGIMGMAGAVLAAMNGYDPLSASIAAGAAGAAMNEFVLERWERNVGYHNIPKHTLDHRYRLAQDVKLQRFNDPQLQISRELLQQAKASRDELKAQQEILSAEIDEFMKQYPM